jgi:hypothetical protein
LTYDISVIWNTMIVSYIKLFSDTTYLEFSWILNVWHLQCHHTLSAGCAASVTSGCKSPTYREAIWGEFEGPDLSDKENHLAQKWWTQFFWGSPHACTTIIMYIYIWISPNHSIKQFLDPLLLLEIKPSDIFFPLRPPTLQGLKDWGSNFSVDGFTKFLWRPVVFCKPHCLLKNQVLHAFSCDVFSSMFWNQSSDETSEERHSKSSSKKVYKLL